MSEESCPFEEWMQENYPEIDHYQDAWSIARKAWEAGEQRILHNWVDSITESA